MHETHDITESHTFVIRIWPEWSFSGPRWRGYILHLHTGEKFWFQDVNVPAFIELMAGFVEGAHGDP